MNLDRLKNTEYLVPGFDSFLAKWLSGSTPSDVKIDWSEEQWQCAERLPNSVREFYEVVYKWPDANIHLPESPAKNRLIVPPAKRERGPYSVEYDYLNENSIALANDNDRRWEVWYSLNDHDKYQLYSLPKAVRATPFPMDSRIDEFLIALGFSQLVTNLPANKDPQSGPFDRAELIYTGRYFADYLLEVYHHESGYLWLGFENEPYALSYREQ